MVNIYKFCKKDVLIQQPGESWEQHLGDVQPTEKRCLVNLSETFKNLLFWALLSCQNPFLAILKNNSKKRSSDGH